MLELTLRVKEFHFIGLHRQSRRAYIVNAKARLSICKNETIYTLKTLFHSSHQTSHMPWIYFFKKKHMNKTSC